MPCFVLTVVPSTIGRMSRCTPSRLTSGPCTPSRPAILSISSTNMMPACSTRSTANRLTLSMSTSFCSSSWLRCCSASGTLRRRFRGRPWKRLGSMSFTLMSISSIEEPVMTSNEGTDRSRISISTTRASSRPPCSWSRNFSRVRCACSLAAAASGASATGRTGGRSRSSRRSSAFSRAFPRTSTSCCSRTMSTASSTRSRTIDSTSRPTYPTSVNFDASTLMNGDRARRASRRAISVLPTPVGPIIRMFFGATSSASSGGSFWRRIRFRSATATARFAFVCPTTYLSSSATI